jgi:hypothetical protein
MKAIPLTFASITEQTGTTSGLARRDPEGESARVAVSFISRSHLKRMLAAAQFLDMHSHAAAA